MPRDGNRRAPAAPTSIEDISPEQGGRVRILGTVLEVRDDSIMIDDGTGTTEVFVNEEDRESLQDGQRVRVFGRVLPTPDSFEIQGEIVQDMSELDMDLYEDVADTVPRSRMP